MKMMVSKLSSWFRGLDTSGKFAVVLLGGLLVSAFFQFSLMLYSLLFLSNGLGLLYRLW